MNTLSRRHLLQMLPACLVLPACSDAGSTSSSSGTAVTEVRVALSATRVGAFTSTTEGVIVGRDSKGLYAFTNVCTHTGCAVPCPTAIGTLTCPCHGSTYNGNGDLLGGPAPAALNHFKVRIEGTDVIISKGEVESDRSLRVAVA